MVQIRNSGNNRRVDGIDQRDGTKNRMQQIACNKSHAKVNGKMHQIKIKILPNGTNAELC